MTYSERSRQHPQLSEFSRRLAFKVFWLNGGPRPEHEVEFTTPALADQWAQLMVWRKPT